MNMSNQLVSWIINSCIYNIGVNWSAIIRILLSNSCYNVSISVKENLDGEVWSNPGEVAHMTTKIDLSLGTYLELQIPVSDVDPLLYPEQQPDSLVWQEPTL